jgi:DNA-binding response OmpR family regulator
MSKPSILVIEDHADTRRFLESILKREFDVLTAENAIIGIDLARNRHPQLILLDVMLPILNGFDACSLLKGDDKTKMIPIIFLSAKGAIPDITGGLDKGADDYIPKPFDIKEVQARIHARLRKQGQNPFESQQIGDLLINPVDREARYAGQTLHLTTTEFDILRHLAGRAGQTVSRAEILREVWRSDQDRVASDRTIDVHIRAIRRKSPPMIKHIISIYGVGYKYEK